MKHASSAAASRMESTEVEDETMDNLVTAVSRLSTSSSDNPSSISFGRNRNRGLTFLPRAVVQQERRAFTSDT
ncbi:unnamed protein product [Cuscuta campestris]|uniref:Uncharacterized protein n=1 Tax=Cuscuta campestris TaxID=132261 RepID=A0A484LAP4_9ASTE|nr:unnamed protein product [Cuscuta campestris]